MKKRWISGLMVAALSMSLVACGQGAEGGNNASSDAQATVAEANSADADKQADAAAAEAQKAEEEAKKAAEEEAKQAEEEAKRLAEEAALAEANAVYRRVSCQSFYDGQEYGMSTYDYDDAGNMIRWGTETYEYDANGNMTRYNYYLDESLTTLYGYTVYTYDSDNRLIEEKPMGVSWNDGSEVTQEYYGYEYDDEGRISRKTMYWGSIVTSFGQPCFFYDYSYNADGTIDTIQVRNDDGSKSDVYVHEYDGNGNLTLFRDTYEGAVYEEKKYTYDDNGNLLSEEDYSMSWEGDMVPAQTISYTYDDHGNCLTEEHHYFEDIYGGDWTEKYVIEWERVE